ncbi:MAG: nucleotidyl transferase AbiEii/AbiGii toxin family protein [bacterium]|nr:nucleotidyl transferase AbiEii/AbiGii toxin family protein [bacterium]
MEQREVTNLLKIVAQILEKLDIPYFLTGGVAVAKWGAPRFTADIDIVVQLVAKNLDKLADELLAIDKYAYVDKDAMRNALDHLGEFNFIHRTSGVKVDFWVLQRDKFNQNRMSRRVPVDVAGQKVYFSTPEDLILSKLNWFKESQSSRHLEDIGSVLDKQRALDLDYLKRGAVDQRVSDTLETLLKQK